MYSHKLTHRLSAACLPGISFLKITCPEGQNNVMKKRGHKGAGLNPSSAIHLLDDLGQASGLFSIQESPVVISNLDSYGEY